MMPPWDFDVQKREDLLIWADLWEDHGAPRQGNSLRLLHAEKRWPRREKGAYCWSIMRESVWSLYATVRNRKCSIPAELYGVPHSRRATVTRRYPSLRTAFMDLMFCMVSMVDPKE